ncbi:MAG: hypothetical protein MRK01_07025 [Candidatus Scalindua sp.]|nr:hypothetical protein [Candidatus Scalindua sp.]
MLGLNEHASIIVFPILFVVVVTRIVLYFIERGKIRNCRQQAEQREKSPQVIPVKRVKENKNEEKLNVGKEETRRKVPDGINVKQQREQTDKPEDNKSINVSQGDKISVPVSIQEQKQSIHQPGMLASGKEKATSGQWEEVEKKWIQIKNNDSCKIVRKILGPPTSIKPLEENRELWVYVYGLKEKRTLTFNCGILEKTEIGENVFAKALMDLQAKKS